MKWLWIFLFILILGVIFTINPNLPSAKIGDSRKQLLEKPLIPIPHFFQESDIKGQKPPVFFYRGNPQRTGVTWTTDLHPMARPLWRIPDFNNEIHGASKSSPISDGDAYYLGNDRGNFVRVNKAGKVDWRISTTASKGIHGSAVIVDNAVFWGDYEGILYSADKSTGKINWLVDLGDTIGASPLYVDGSIFISVETFYPANGFIARVDAKNGNVIWLSPYLGDHPHSSPALSQDGSRLYVGANSNYLFALDIISGKIIWQFQVEGPIKGTPAVWEDDIYFGSWDNYFYRISKDGNLIWKTDVEEKSQSSATFSKSLGLVFTSSNAGKTFAFDIKNGKKVWQHEGVGGFISSPSLVIDQKNKREILYANCLIKSLCQFDPKTGKILRQFKFDSGLSSVPLIENGQLFVSLDGKGGFIKWY